MFMSPSELRPYLNRNIGEICGFSLGKNNRQNHCAHFVSHVMGYEFAHTCKNFTLADKQKSEPGACMRVDEVFSACVKRGSWNEKLPNLTSGLIFVTLSGNIERLGNVLRMRNGPQKHLGIFIGDRVWNYSNTNQKVVSDSMKSFFEKFQHVYRAPGNTVEFFYGEFLR